MMERGENVKQREKEKGNKRDENQRKKLGTGVHIYSCSLGSIESLGPGKKEGQGRLKKKKIEINDSGT